MAEPKLTPEEFKRRITPDHLETQEELKESVLKSVEPEEETSKREKFLADPKAQKKYTFTLKWKDGSGKLWEGKFTNKILSIRDRQLVGVTRAKLQGGMPIESIDQLTEETNLIVAHLMFSLEEAPEWAKDLTALDDIQLLQAIYAEVASHEAYFFGWRPTESKGEAKS